MPSDFTPLGATPLDFMPSDHKPFENFNLETMSGIFPGSRTLVYQRLRLRPEEGSAQAWLQLQWYTDPPAAVLRAVSSTQPHADLQVRLAEPTDASFTARLHHALAERSVAVDVCFTCRHWQPLPLRTAEGLPVGRCAWGENLVENAPQTPDQLAHQSALSLACDHFQQASTLAPIPASGASVQSAPVPKSAELDPDRLPFWPRLLHTLRRRPRLPEDWATRILERSGVGAGTEPCFVCQGRLANLGALAVASPEDDKQTLSVWRCRSCFTTYLNDWTDRWERLDNLETEERYYRIAPSEAYAALRVIHATDGGDHPAKRHERRQQRAQILALLSDKLPLSHQVRQGR
jgi:hypothetical protein